MSVLSTAHASQLQGQLRRCVLPDHEYIREPLLLVAGFIAARVALRNRHQACRSAVRVASVLSTEPSDQVLRDEQDPVPGLLSTRVGPVLSPPSFLARRCALGR